MRGREGERSPSTPAVRSLASGGGRASATTGDPAMKGPLEGIRILDLTNVLAGPFCTYQLALMGAEVIKIERPGEGDLARRLGADPELNARRMGASFLAQNAAKKSLALDLKKPRGKEVFRRLVETADALVENFRPGVMERLGFGWEALRKIRPELVYLSISGFGQSGPLRDNPAYDQIIQGLAGVMRVTGDRRSAPLRVGFPVADTMGGMTAAFALAAALLGSQRRGEGVRIDVSMLESTLAAMGWAVSNWLIAGVPPQPMGNENMTAAPSGSFRTGRGLLNIAANEQRQFETLCRLLGRPELVADARFADREARKANREALRDEIEQALADRSARQWAALLNAHGVPAGEVLSLPEILAHPQIRERDFVHVFADPPGVGRPIALVRGGWRIAGMEEASGPDAPPPPLGADSDAILAGIGYSEAEIAALRREGVIG